MGYQTVEIQATSANIKTKAYEVINTAVYCPLRYAIKKDQYVDLLNSQTYRFMVDGDFNAKQTHWVLQL